MFTPCHREEGALRLTWRSHALDLDGVAWFDSTRLRRYARNDIIKDTFASLLNIQTTHDRCTGVDASRSALYIASTLQKKRFQPPTRPAVYGCFF